MNYKSSALELANIKPSTYNTTYEVFHVNRLRSLPFSRFFGFVVVLPWSKDNCIYHIICDCGKRNYHGRNYHCILLYGESSVRDRLVDYPRLVREQSCSKTVYKMCFVVSFSCKKKKKNENEENTHSAGEFIHRLRAPVLVSLSILHRRTWKNFGDSFSNKSSLVTLFIPQEMQNALSRNKLQKAYCHATHCKVHCQAKCKVHFHATHCKVHSEVPTLWQFLVCTHVTRRPCWLAIQYNFFSQNLHNNKV